MRDPQPACGSCGGEIVRCPHVRRVAWDHVTIPGDGPCAHQHSADGPASDPSLPGAIVLRRRPDPDRLRYLASRLLEGDGSRVSVALALEVMAGDEIEPGPGRRLIIMRSTLREYLVLHPLAKALAGNGARGRRSGQ